MAIGLRGVVVSEAVMSYKSTIQLSMWNTCGALVLLHDVIASNLRYSLGYRLSSCTTLAWLLFGIRMFYSFFSFFFFLSLPFPSLPFLFFFPALGVGWRWRGDIYINVDDHPSFTFDISIHNSLFSYQLHHIIQYHWSSRTPDIQASHALVLSCLTTARVRHLVTLASTGCRGAHPLPLWIIHIWWAKSVFLNATSITLIYLIFM